MKRKAKSRLGYTIVHLLVFISLGVALPVRSQSNQKVKLTGTVYEYDYKNKRIPLGFATVSIPEITLGTTSNENGKYTLEMYLPARFVCRFNI